MPSAILRGIMLLLLTFYMAIHKRDNLYSPNQDHRQAQIVVTVNPMTGKVTAELGRRWRPVRS